MAIFTTIAGGATLANKAGINLSGVKNFVGGFFGGGSEPNAGTEDFLDALDNYEGISTNRARTLQTEIENLIRSGASDRRIGQAVTSAGGYSNVNDVMSSWKWRIVQGFIDQARMNLKSSSGPVSLPGSQSMAGTNSGFSNPLLWGAVGLLSIFLIFRS